MPYLMVCIDKPDAGKDSLALANWRQAVQDVDMHIGPDAGIEKPTENVWLIPLPNALGFLRKLLVRLDKHEPKFHLLNAQPESCVWKTSPTLLPEINSQFSSPPSLPLQTRSRF